MTDTTVLSRVRSWFGRPPADEDDGAAPSIAADHERESALALASRQTLEAIGDLVLSHRLPVDRETLAFAYDIATDANPALAGQVQRRIHAGLPLTREWIVEISAGAKGDDTQTMLNLRDRLEKAVSDFTQTTRDAKTATSDYRMALRNHVDELDDVHKTGAMIHELATVARAMLERTQEIEAQMARSESETRTLQRRLDEARRFADLDHLTGLPNRRAFETLLATEYEEARRFRDSLCVAFCDIDRFKAINDTHGHDAGDRVLKLVARSLSEISDDRCHVARHGGEEFVVLFRGKTLGEAFDVLDATRENLAARRLVNRATDTPFGQVSFSAGIADLFAYSDPRAALKAADQALYSAKDQGRNRIVLSSPREFQPQAIAEIRP